VPLARDRVPVLVGRRELHNGHTGRNLGHLAAFRLVPAAALLAPLGDRAPRTCHRFLPCRDGRIPHAGAQRFKIKVLREAEVRSARGMPPHADYAACRDLTTRTESEL